MKKSVSKLLGRPLNERHDNSKRCVHCARPKCLDPKACEAHARAVYSNIQDGRKAPGA